MNNKRMLSLSFAVRLAPLCCILRLDVDNWKRIQFLKNGEQLSNARFTLQRLTFDSVVVWKFTP